MLFSRSFFGIGLAFMLAGAGVADGELRFHLKTGGGEIHVDIPEPIGSSTDAVTEWMQRAATAVSHFYGRYPVKRVTLIVLPANHGRVKDGVENGGDRITIRLGPRVSTAELNDDWMLTHEMFHLSQPDLDEKYSWMSEGMADYLEPLARLSVGQIDEKRFWKDLVEGLPQGLPEAGDRGLDHTHTWARTYWGGCLFWFLADVRIHQQTNNQKSVRDAAIAVLDAGGDGSWEWPLDKLLTTYDQGTGTTVFRDLHVEMGGKAVETDLAGLWKSLGVVYEEGLIRFDDGAPMAGIRQKITARWDKCPMPKSQ